MIRCWSSKERRQVTLNETVTSSTLLVRNLRFCLSASTGINDVATEVFFGVNWAFESSRSTSDIPRGVLIKLLILQEMHAFAGQYAGTLLSMIEMIESASLSYG